MCSELGRFGLQNCAGYVSCLKIERFQNPGATLPLNKEVLHDKRLPTFE